MSISQMERPSLREVKIPVQGHTASQWQSPDLYPESLGMEPLLLPITLPAS